MTRWVTDLTWRVAASEKQIERKYEPERNRPIKQLLTDETETSVFKQPEKVFGLAVRYEERNPDFFDSEEEEQLEQQLRPVARKKAAEDDKKPMIFGKR